MQDKKMELYKQFQGQYCDMLSMASEAYNKALLGLSISIIGFTFAVLKFADKPIQNLCQLKLSWTFFTITIFLILISFVATQQHAQHRIRYINSIIDEKNNVKFEHASDWLMYWTTLLAGVTFFIGIACFAFFCWENINTSVS